jgi:hypothetical protein
MFYPMINKYYELCASQLQDSAALQVSSSSPANKNVNEFPVNSLLNVYELMHEINGKRSLLQNNFDYKQVRFYFLNNSIVQNLFSTDNTNKNNDENNEREMETFLHSFNSS